MMQPRVIKVPNDIVKLKCDWYEFKKAIKYRDEVILGLRKQVISQEKLPNLFEGFLIELHAKRKEPGLLESLEKRILMEIQTAKSVKTVSEGIRRERKSGGGI
jgi:hypothetical protein